jgi:hypothetical protein
MNLSEDLKAYLEEKNLPLRCPTRGALRRYSKEERPLVKACNVKAGEEDDAGEIKERVEDALDALFDFRERFVGDLYPEIAVQDMPANVYEELFSAIFAKARGAAQGN